MRNVLNFMLISLVILAASIPAAAMTIGTFGTTYAIAERDGLDEVMERAKNTDWSKYINKKQYKESMLNQISRFEAPLPKARSGSVRLIDMTYTLDFNIYDANGNVLYPKGFSFNPLAYMSMPYTIVVIDGTDKSQVKWLRTGGYGIKGGSLVLTTAGDTASLIKDIKRPVFVADRRLVDKYQLRAVPSVIVQKGLNMEVTEVVIPDKK